MSTPIGKQAADAVILGMMDAAIKGNKLAKASKRTAKPLKTQPRKAKLKKAGKKKKRNSKILVFSKNGEKTKPLKKLKK